MSKRCFRCFLTPAVMALLLPAGAAFADTPEISLNGEGQVRYIPDSARLSFTINAEHQDSDKALAQVRKTMGQWRDAISDVRDQLVDYSDASVHLYQRREPPRPLPDGTMKDERKTVAVASQTISFEVHDLALLNPVLEKAQNLGMNYSLGQHQFFHSDEEKLQQDALARAIRNAKSRCEFAAAQLDMACGEVKSLSLHSSGGGPVLMRMAEATSAKADTISEPGPREISASVQATFTLE